MRLLITAAATAAVIIGCADQPPDPDTTVSTLDDSTMESVLEAPYPIGGACHVSYYSNGTLLYTVNGSAACCYGGCNGAADCCLIGLGETESPFCYKWGTNAGACGGV